MSKWEDVDDLKDFLTVLIKEYPTPDEIPTLRKLKKSPEDYDTDMEKVMNYTTLVNDIGESIVDDILGEKKKGKDLEVDVPTPGNPANIPYVAILDPSETGSTKYGRYMVYLLDPYEESVHLSLEVGGEKTGRDYAKRIRQTESVEDDRNAVDVLSWVANWYQGTCEPPSGFGPGPINFDDRLDRKGPLYGNGTIYYKEYSLDSLPRRSQLIEELNGMLETYDNLLERKASNIDTSGSDYDIWHISPETDPGSEGTKRWDGWREDKVASIGWELDPGDFSTDPEEINSINDTDYGKGEGQGMAFQFAHEISEGDVVLAAIRKKGGSDPHEIYGVGRVTDTEDAEPDDLHEDLNQDSHFVGVDWVEFDTMIPITLGNDIPLTHKAITKLNIEEFCHVLGTTVAYAVAGGLYTDVAEAVNHISSEIDVGLEYVEDGEEKTTEKRLSEDEEGEEDSKDVVSVDDLNLTEPDFDISPEDVCPDDALFFKQEDDPVPEAIEALARGDHILFVGPPGTGKSELATYLCDSIVGEDSYRLTTATADWSTFDTIGGYRQKTDGKLRFHPGLFLECFRGEGGETPGGPTNEWLVVDEFNRADIDKAFGPLFTVLTGDDTTLPFEDDGQRITVYGSGYSDMKEVDETEYVVPDDWRMLATMNTFDKSSLYDMSYALGRRFSYVHVPAPSKDEIDKDLLQSYAECWDIEVNVDSVEGSLVELWKEVQGERPIGPAIIRDVLKASTEEDDEVDLTPGVTESVLPQFEGVMNAVQREIVRDLADIECVNETAVEKFGRQYFNLTDLDI